MSSKPKVLVTAGPVYSHLDSTTVLTQRIKGIEILNLALHLSRACSVTLLASRETLDELPKGHRLITMPHSGYDYYAHKVLDLAPEMDALILGGVIPNLIPVSELRRTVEKDKVVAIDFYSPSRVIDKVKKVAPDVILIGYILNGNMVLAAQFEKGHSLIESSDADAVIVSNPGNASNPYLLTRTAEISAYSPDDILNLIKIGRAKHEDGAVRAGRF